jgi:hypothetical protein
MHTSDLPAELLLKICSYVDDHTTLLRLRAANRAFFDIFTPKAFASFPFSNRPRSGTRMSDLLKSRYKHLVNTVVYRDVDADKDRNELEQIPGIKPSSFSSQHINRLVDHRVL